ncbi:MULTISPECIES: hypothetical protein [Streptomyces]|uniref:hypothetical protein n=1 Tax=Streptomyces lycopersici TaxID=2974589 RepID=UPI0021CE55EB|nr:hypothetical protein [Streptomyces sp. NEAU-383]
MHIKGMLKASGVMAAAVVVSLTMATGAHAASHEMKTDDGDPGGKLTFNSDGDKIKVCDEQADGWSAVAYVINPDGSTRYSLSARGNGNCTPRSADDGGRYNLHDGTDYTFRVCLDHDGSGTGDDRFCDSARWTA